MAFRFQIPQYLTRRAADWKERGFTETQRSPVSVEQLRALGKICQRARQALDLIDGDHW
jgi:hypothetical protein